MHVNISNMLGAFRGDRELHKLYDEDLFLENKIENGLLHMRKDLSYACKAKKLLTKPLIVEEYFHFKGLGRRKLEYEISEL